MKIDIDSFPVLSSSGSILCFLFNSDSNSHDHRGQAVGITECSGLGLTPGEMREAGGMEAGHIAPWKE